MSFFPQTASHYFLSGSYETAKESRIRSDASGLSSSLFQNCQAGSFSLSPGFFSGFLPDTLPELQFLNAFQFISVWHKICY
jgi:hypothetical protein